MRLSDDRIAHMHGVAEYMYDHAEEYGLGAGKDEMYILGIVHDIGYLYGDLGHEQTGGELLGSDSYYGHFVSAHGLTSREYMKKHACFQHEIPKELLLLWTADLSVDLKGKEVGFQKRLEDIALRHGRDSEAYRKCEETIAWLENRKAIGFLCGNQKT